MLLCCCCCCAAGSLQHLLLHQAGAADRESAASRRRTSKLASTLRRQVGFSFSIGKPSKAMMIPTVWVVTQTGVPIETTYLDLDDTAILITTKDLALEQLLENWFQTSRRTTSSQIKNVAMICSHPHHISSMNK